MDHKKFKCASLQSQDKERNQIHTQVCSLLFCFCNNWCWLLSFYPFSYNLDSQEKIKCLYFQRAYSNATLSKKK